MEEKRVRCFCLALDDREERLRDLILLRRLPALALSLFLVFYVLTSFFFSQSLFYLYYIYMCDCISLLLLDVIGSNSSFCFVIFFSCVS